jgi:hypothetical protein
VSGGALTRRPAVTLSRYRTLAGTQQLAESQQMRTLVRWGAGDSASLSSNDSGPEELFLGQCQ